MEQINWTDPKAKISKYFTVHECLYLPSWECYHIPSEEEKKNILEMAQKMDLVREYLGNPIIVHVWIRPKIVNNPKSKYHAKNYNAAVGGAPGSAHPEGKAVDFHVAKMMCSEVRTVLVTKLKEFDIRMEDVDSEGWVHLDCRQPPPKKNRYFKP